MNISGLNTSALSLVLASIYRNSAEYPFLLILQDADEAAYVYHDLRQILQDNDVFFFPSSYKKAIKLSQLDASNEILRTEVLNRLANHTAPAIVVTYPEALCPKVISRNS